MKRLFGQAVFSVADRLYSWEDVVLAARLWGEWEAVETRTREGLACLARLRRGRETLDERDVEAAANAFRYDRDLISGDEAKAWLERWGLIAEQWKEYLRWTVLRERSSGGQAAADAEPAGADETASYVAVEAICSGDLARFARKLAGRAAVASLAREAAYEAGAATGTWDARFSTTVEPAPEEWPGVAKAVIRDKVENLALVERRYEAMLPQIVTPKAVAEQLRLRYFDWIRLECEAVGFPDEGMAREVALGVREDGMAFDEVVAEAGRKVRRASWYMDGLDPAMQNALIAASPGELVGPIPVDDRYVLVVLREKLVPSADDPETAKRAEAAALDAALTREINDRVRWHWRQ
jgi:hypothetical protein